MALCSDEISIAADSLHRAETSRTQIRQMSIADANITIDDAYAIGARWFAIKIAERGTIKRHKIGLTSRAIKSTLNIDEPDCGVLFDNRFFADGGAGRRRCSIIPQLRSPSLPTRSLRRDQCSSLARSCSQHRSSARSRPARATQSRPTMAAMGRSAATSAKVE
jgi:hypothetical protein